MHPLDLLKIKFQVAKDKPKGGVGRAIWNSLREIKDTQGWRGLYRGVGPNIAGNASSWGLYFLLWVIAKRLEYLHWGVLTERDGLFSYNMLKQRASGGDPSYQMSPGSYLLCSAEASSQTPNLYGLTWIPDHFICALGAVTAIMTNPIWVVKVRMFTTKPEEPTAYRSHSRTSH